MLLLGNATTVKLSFTRNNEARPFHIHLRADDAELDNTYILAKRNGRDWSITRLELLQDTGVTFAQKKDTGVTAFYHAFVELGKFVKAHRDPRIKSLVPTAQSLAHFMLQ